MSQPAENTDHLTDSPDGPDSLHALTMLPEAVEVDAAHRALHAELLTRLRREAKAAPAFGTLQDILLERVATQFTLVRAKESTDLTDARVIKEMNALLLQTIDTIHRQARSNSDLTGLKEHVYELVAESLDQVTANLPPEMRQLVMDGVADKMEKLGV